MINLIKRLLEQLISDIDAGNSNVTEKEAMEILDVLKRYSQRDIPMSKYQACKYVGVSRATLMVVSIASSAGQFFNSISHELVHLAVHICMADSVPLHTEELCYLVGDTAHRIFPKITRYICTCGRCEKKKE